MGIQDENMDMQEDEDIKRDKPDLDVEQDDSDEEDLEQERTEERTVVKVKRDPDRREGESRSQYKLRKAHERTAEQIKEHVGPIAQQLAELRSMLASRGAEPRQVQTQAPMEKKSGSRFGDGYQKLTRQQDLILKSIRASEDPAEIESLTNDFRALEEEKRELEIKALMPKEQEQRRQNVDPAQEYWIRALQAEFADVYRNEDAVNYATALARADNVKRKARGLPLRTLDDDRVTMAQVAEELGIRKPKAAKPTESAKKLGGVGATPSRGSGMEYELTAEQISLAEDMFPNDPDAPRKWVKRMRARGALK